MALTLTASETRAKPLIPPDPDQVMVIRRLTPNILTCSTPFLRFGKIKIGGRGTIVKLASGALAVFSPTALTDRVRENMQEQLGTKDVRYIAALDQEHHIFLESWHKEYPQAAVLAPDTLPDYRDKQGYFQIPGMNWHLFKVDDRAAGFSVDPEFNSEFDMEYVDAHPNKELVFNHKPSRTLIEADLIFNLPGTEQMSRTGESATSGFLTKFFASLNTTKGSAIWQKRFIWYAISSAGRKQYSQSIARINQWDFDRLIPCHGDVIETGGKGIFQKVMEWHIEAAKKSK